MFACLFRAFLSQERSSEILRVGALLSLCTTTSPPSGERDRILLSNVNTSLKRCLWKIGKVASGFYCP
jgi:hypothetical protein